jgi:formate dehydrogenase subunit gamma
VTSTGVRPVEPDLVRFDRVSRVVHWTTASLFGVLMLTGAALYAGPISTIVGQRDVMRTIHVIAGIALPLPLIIGVLGRYGVRLRDNISRLNRWTGEDRAWLHKRSRAAVRLGKFNPGQKLNSMFFGAAVVVMLGSGIMLKWFSIVPLDWRVGATFVHDWFALAIWLSVGAHVLFAFRDPIAMRGMRRGTVTARWARTERPVWYEEETSRSPDQADQLPRSTPQSG